MQVGGVMFSVSSFVGAGGDPSLNIVGFGYDESITTVAQLGVMLMNSFGILVEGAGV